MKSHDLLSILTLGALVVGCAQAPASVQDELAARGINFNGINFNGVQLQGPILEGALLQGIILKGSTPLEGPLVQTPILERVHLTGAVQGLLAGAPQLQGSMLTGHVRGGSGTIAVSGDDFIGSLWDLRVVQLDALNQQISESYTLRIDDVHAHPDQDDVFLYEIVHRPQSGGEWKPLCTDAEGGMVPAVPLRYYWNLDTGDRVDDENVFTFACADAVLAKCTFWGYRPWATATRCADEGSGDCQELSLQDYHQACTRMARADYCGDGTSWTVDGTAIDIWDHLAPQLQAPETDWAIEAEWTPDGALCVDDIRQQAWKDEGLYPECFLDDNGEPMKLMDCGSMAGHRALLASAFDADGE